MDAMIDIETLGTRPSAVVLSIGAVLFDGKEVEPDVFYVRLDAETQIRRGRSVDFSVVKWWTEQTATVTAEAFGGKRIHPGSALSGLSLFFKRANVERVWAKSPQFDCVILEHMSHDLDQKVPWKFRDLRDVRTLVEFADLPGDWEPMVGAQPGYELHHPVYDCVRQALTVAECLDRLDRGE